MLTDVKTTYKKLTRTPLAETQHIRSLNAELNRRLRQLITKDEMHAETYNSLILESDVLAMLADQYHTASPMGSPLIAQRFYQQLEKLQTTYDNIKNAEN